MQNKIQILSTKKISDALIRVAEASHICIDQVSFIETKEVISPDLERRISALSTQNVTVIFTSLNAVNAVGKMVQTKPSWKIYCIEPATKMVVERVFGKENIAGSAINADQLADKILNANSAKEIVFFCGDKRRNVLREKLKKQGIRLEEIIVYQTIEKPQTISITYDGILFFSPSAVQSFFLKNRINNKSQLFAIGATTAEAARSFTQQLVIVSEIPSAENLINKAISFFTTNKVF